MLMFLPTLSTLFFIMRMMFNRFYFDIATPPTLLRTPIPTYHSTYFPCAKQFRKHANATSSFQFHLDCFMPVVDFVFSFGSAILAAGTHVKAKTNRYLGSERIREVVVKLNITAWIARSLLRGEYMSIEKCKNSLQGICHSSTCQSRLGSSYLVQRT